MNRDRRMRRIARCAVFTALAALGPRAVAQQIEPLTFDRRTPVVRVFEVARDAVVNISTTRLAKTRLGFFGTQDDLYDRIFQSPFFTREVPVKSLGSGFIVHPQGYIVTNEHVVRRAMEIDVYLADTTTHKARVIAVDREHDLAILKMAPPAGSPLPALSLGRSDDLMIGESVVAIGNPKGYRHSVTAGVVSALQRELKFPRGVAYTGLIQTDASINPGSSGGPLLNINAEVIGINTAIQADAEGIGFAIAVDDLTEDLPRLLDFRRINRVIVGMEVSQTRRSGAARLVVDQVSPGGPADRAGIRAGQVVAEIDGRPAGTLADYYVQMLGKNAGDTLSLQTRDGEKTGRFAIRLLPRPKPDGEALTNTWLAVSVRPVTPELSRRLKLPLAGGLLITRVVRGGLADRVGMQVRDVLFQLGRHYVTSLDDIGRVLEDARAGQVLRIGFARGSARYIGSIRLGDEGTP